MDKAIRWHCRDRILQGRERPLVMGVLNVTPDSFSDGGKYSGTRAAVERGVQMASEGADILDVGGESTRPGASEVPEAEEIRRVVPVIEALARETDTAVSTDTMKSAVAERAVEHGACIINDVSGCTHDREMISVAARSGAGLVLMHMRGTPRIMQENPSYGNVVSEVAKYLAERTAEVTANGVSRDAVAVDPGIGFGKTVEHNLELLANIERLRVGNVPVVVGLSRKSTLGKLTGRNIEERLAGSLAGLVYCALKGADILRVHDVRESIDALKVAMAIKEHEP
ncbi:MAG: dihydropteroate synthase [Kiritimatiellia bacterium]